LLCSELLIQKYLEIGATSFCKYDGEYTIALYDEEIDNLYLSNNEFGTFPLFIYNGDKHIIFSNEYEPILKYVKFDKRIEINRVAELFLFGSTIGGKTFFPNINNLDPGSILKIKCGTHSIEKTNESISINYNRKIEDFADEFLVHLKNAIKRRVDLFEKNTIALSGGIDSRLIISSFPNEFKGKLEVLSFKSDLLAADQDRDVLIAKEIANLLGLNHRIENFSNWWPLWTQEFNTDFFANLRLRNNRYIITGHYGSELLQGDFVHLIPKSALDLFYQSANFKVNKTSILKSKFFNRAIIKNKNLYSLQFGKRLNTVRNNVYNEILKQKHENKFLSFTIEHLIRNFFSNMYGGAMGVWIMTYIFTKEMFMPFIDRNILRLLLSMPPDYLIKDNMKFYNYLFSNHLSELNGIPTSSYFGKSNSTYLNYTEKGINSDSMRISNYKKAYYDCINYLKNSELDFINIETFSNYVGKENNQDIRTIIEFVTWVKYINEI